MDTLKKKLEQREKLELIAIIQHMLRQEPELQWLLTTPLPTALSRESSVDPVVYRQQILAAMAAGDDRRKRKRGEVERRLTVIKTIADEFAAQENYVAALTIYEVLVTEVIEHFNDYRDEYVAFSVILMGWIAVLQAKRKTGKCGCAFYERSSPSTASIPIARWTWMKISLVCCWATLR